MNEAPLVEDLRTQLQGLIKNNSEALDALKSGPYSEWEKARDHVRKIFEAGQMVRYQLMWSILRERGLELCSAGEHSRDESHDPRVLGIYPQEEIQLVYRDSIADPTTYGPWDLGEYENIRTQVLLRSCPEHLKDRYQPSPKTGPKGLRIFEQCLVGRDRQPIQVKYKYERVDFGNVMRYFGIPDLSKI